MLAAADASLPLYLIARCTGENVGESASLLFLETFPDCIRFRESEPPSEECFLGFRDQLIDRENPRHHRLIKMELCSQVLPKPSGIEGHQLLTCEINLCVAQAFPHEVFNQLQLLDFAGTGRTLQHFHLDVRKPGELCRSERALAGH